MSVQVLSNSPLQTVPNDYCPDGSDNWFTIPSGVDAGKKMFYMDYSPAGVTPEKTVLFVHGNPECSYTYRHVQAQLQASSAPLRVVSADHIGFGISDQADFEMVDMHHAANLRTLVEHLDLRNIILVIHDWGGPIGVGTFIDQMDRVDGLVLMNTTIFPMPSDGYVYDKWPSKLLPWSRFGKLVPNALWGGAAAFALGSANPQPLPLMYAKAAYSQVKFGLRLIERNTPAYVFSESQRSRANATSSMRNVMQTPVWGHGYSYVDKKHGLQDNHDFYKAIQQQVPDMWGADGRNIPVAAHIGEYDPCGKASVLQQWKQALPSLEGNASTYPNFGHFIEEYKGAEIAQSIIDVSAR